MKSLKKYILLTLSVLLLIACSSNKPEIAKVEPNISRLQPAKENDKDKSNLKTQTTKQSQQDKKTKKQLEKEAKEKKKANEKKNKEADKRKKQDEKAKREKEKQQEELIKNAAKEEKKRIEEERKKEKDALLNTIKENEDKTENDVEEEENKTIVVPVDTMINAAKDLADTTSQTLEDLLGNPTDNSNIVVPTDEKEDNTPDFLKKFKKKKDDISQQKSKKLSTMDKVVYMMEAKNLPDSIDSLGNKVERVTYYNEPKKPNLIKRTWRKLFPKKIERSKTYDKLYEEAPKNILILYPWNRSQYEKADEMLLIMATKEIGKRGYYPYSAIATMEAYKKDTMFSSQYVKTKDIKSLRETYDADAVMFITVYRFDNPYWSTATKAVAHYTLISTKTFDTLFARQLEFNYDTPIPPKEYHNKDMELDSEQVYDLGVMEQMQIYAFQDLPYGPYHKKYKKDQKKFSKQKEIKYKINVRPS